MQGFSRQGPYVIAQVYGPLLEVKYMHRLPIPNKRVSFWNNGSNLSQLNHNNYRRDFPPKFYVSILVCLFLSLQFYFVKYVIVACELPNDNSLDQRMLLKN